MSANQLLSGNASLDVAGQAMIIECLPILIGIKVPDRRSEPSFR